MMKKLVYIIGIILVPILISCNRESEEIGFKGDEVNFGKAKYFEPFLWVESDTIVLNKRLRFEFNDYASECSSKVKLVIVPDSDKNGDFPSNVEFYINDKIIENNAFEINSNDAKNGIVTLGVRFLPGYNDDYMSGFIKVKNTNLDRINNNELSVSGEKRLFKWNAKYRVIMNPLIQVLIWVGVVVLSVLVVWFLFLRNTIYPKMGKGSIFIQGPYVSNPIKTNGVRKIVLTTQAEKQSTLSKIFIGKIVYEVNPFWEEPITLSPFRKRQIRIRLGSIYSIFPFTSTFVRGGGNYELKKNNINFRISYL